MLAIMADHNVEGHLEELLAIWRSPTWSQVWRASGVQIQSFETLHLPYTTPDRDVWLACQRREIVLLTANRAGENQDSLEAVIRELGDISSLLVLTIGDAQRVIHDRDYAHQLAIRVLDVLLNIDHFRGAGRLWVP